MTDLYIIIYDLLHHVPKDIINIIIQYAIRHYKYTVDTPTIYKTMHYNKHLGIIYCASKYSYKLINYKNGCELAKYSDKSRIDISSFESEFVYFGKQRSIHLACITYFDNNIILSYSYSNWRKYILNETQYVLDCTRFMPELQVSCAYNQKLYTFGTRYISEFELTTFDFVQHTHKFKHNNKANDIQISADDDFVYVMESVSKTKHDIYIRNTRSLQQLYKHSVFETSDIVKIYKNYIFSYGNDQIHMYDVLTMDKIETLHIQSFTPKKCDYSMSISNDLLMLANDTQILFYDINQ
jgi:hypothetical protein